MNKEIIVQKNIIRNMFKYDEDYDFESEAKFQEFIDRVHSIAEDEYADEYTRAYKTFEIFLKTHHVDSIAYWLYTDEYEPE